MRNRFVLLVLVVVPVLCLAGASGTTGAVDKSGYNISIDGSLDIPDRTVTYEDSEYNVTHLKAIEPGDSFTARFEVPSEGTTYSWELLDIDTSFYDGGRPTGNTTVTIDTSTLGAEGALTPGTYVLVIRDGSIRTIHPFIVESYDVTADVPGTAEAGSTITVHANVTEKSGYDQTLSGVNMVIGNESISRTVNLSQSAGNISTNVSLGDLPPGNYSVFVAARGTKTFSDQRVPIGLSGGGTLNVTPPPTTCVADAVSGDDDEISLTEIQSAINRWAKGSEVPGTGGETIGLTEIQSLINTWAEGATVSC